MDIEKITATINKGPVVSFFKGISIAMFIFGGILVLGLFITRESISFIAVLPLLVLVFAAFIFFAISEVVLHLRTQTKLLYDLTQFGSKNTEEENEE